MMKKSLLFCLFMTIFFQIPVYGKVLNTGPWRFEVRAAYGTIPFIIEINQKKNTYTGILKNGKETIELNDIKVSDKKIEIPLQTYEMSLEMNPPKKGMMEGFLIRHNKNPVIKTPAIAIHGESDRFPEDKKKPSVDLTGKWAVTLNDEDPDKEYEGVMIFEQKGNTLHGSILTPTGDYRYMEGFVSGNEFEAASFDGVYNYLVKGEVKKGKLKARILSSYRTLIEGKRDEKASLPDAYKQTEVKAKALKFEFPDLQGNKVSLNDPKFKNKPVIIQFFGSWCPNCLDEMNYLIPWYNENQKRGIEIVALAFERSLGPREARAQLLKTQKQKKIPYTLLLAGSTAMDKPAEKIPGIKNFISFPTTVFLNKKHEVIKVHAGFTGPSTGEFYEKWKKEFNETVDKLLN